MEADFAEVQNGNAMDGLMTKALKHLKNVLMNAKKLNLAQPLIFLQLKSGINSDVIYLAMTM